MDVDSYTPGMRPWNDFDELFADLILAIPDGGLLGLPHDISMEELIRRFSEVYEAVRQRQQQRPVISENVKVCDDLER